MKGEVPTVTPGRILGHEGIGVIAAVGAQVSSFARGQGAYLLPSELLISAKLFSQFEPIGVDEH